MLSSLFQSPGSKGNEISKLKEEMSKMRVFNENYRKNQGTTAWRLFIFRMRAITSRSRFEAALVHKPRILSFLVIQAALQHKPQHFNDF